MSLVAMLEAFVLEPMAEFAFCDVAVSWLVLDVGWDMVGLFVYDGLFVYAGAFVLLLFVV